MLTGEIRSQIDQIWNACWTGGISNRLEIIEQIPAREIPANGWRAALHFLALEPCRTIVADNKR